MASAGPAAPRHDVHGSPFRWSTLRFAGRARGPQMVVFEEKPSDRVVAEGDVDFVIASAVKHPHPLVTGVYSVTPALRTW
jgi:hypothetical protein